MSDSAPSALQVITIYPHPSPGRQIQSRISQFCMQETEIGRMNHVLKLMTRLVCERSMVLEVRCAWVQQTRPWEAREAGPACF